MAESAARVPPYGALPLFFASHASITTLMTKTNAFVISRPVIYAASLGFTLISPGLAVASEVLAEQDRAGNRIEVFEAMPMAATAGSCASIR